MYSGSTQRNFAVNRQSNALRTASTVTNQSNALTNISKAQETVARQSKAVNNLSKQMTAVNNQSNALRTASTVNNQGSTLRTASTVNNNMSKQMTAVNSQSNALKGIVDSAKIMPKKQYEHMAFIMKYGVSPRWEPDETKAASASRPEMHPVVAQIKSTLERLHFDKVLDRWFGHKESAEETETLETSDKSLETQLKESEQLDVTERELQSSSSNSFSSAPISLSFHFDGNVNREDVKRGVEESMPAIRETFEAQMARYKHEVSRRAF